MVNSARKRRWKGAHDIGDTSSLVASVTRDGEGKQDPTRWEGGGQGWAISDAAAVSWVFLFWLVGGYLNTQSYLMAPRWAPKGCAGRAGGLIALNFQVACLSAVALAFGLEMAVPSILTHHVHLLGLHLWR